MSFFERILCIVRRWGGEGREITSKGVSQIPLESLGGGRRYDINHPHQGKGGGGRISGGYRARKGRGNHWPVLIRRRGKRVVESFLRKEKCINGYLQGKESRGRVRLKKD